MVIKSGFGIEHETHFITTDGKGNFETSTGNLEGLKYRINRERDATVWNNMELVSKNPFDKPHKIVKNLIKREKEGDGSPVPFGTVLTESRYSRPGSYHLNMTLPYDDNTIEQDLPKYHAKIREGMRNIRWLQPLMMGMLGGISRKSIGNPQFPEGSERQLYDAFANIGGMGLKDDDTLTGKSIQQGDRVKKTFKNWMNTYFTSPTHGHSKAPGKYNNRNPKLDLTKHLHTDSAGSNSPNENRDIGDWTVKGFVSNRYGRNNPKTVEFRFLDTFHPSGIYEVIKLVTYAMENGEHTDINADPSDNISWKKATRRIMEEGWDAQVKKEYWTNLAKEMKLNIEFPDTKTLRTDKGFELVIEALHKKNKNGFFPKHYLSGSNKPVLHNFNRDNWEYNIKIKLNKDVTFHNKLKKFMLGLAKIDASESNGWLNVEIKSNKIAVRDILMLNMGFEYGAEDYRDILYFLENQKYILIKENVDGTIDKIKLVKKITSTQQIQDKLIEMKNTNKFFSNTIGLENYEINPETVVTTTELEEEQQQNESDRETVSHSIPISNLRNDANDLIVTFEDILVDCSFVSRSAEDLDWKIGFVSDVPYKVGYIKNRRLVNIFLNENEFPTTFREGIFVEWARKFKDIINLDTQERQNPTNLPTLDFINKIVTTIRDLDLKRQKNSCSDTIIKLNNAGILTLQRNGIRIASIKNGYMYVLVSKLNYAQAQHKFGKLRFIKNIPYYKNYNVKIRDNIATLYKKQQFINKVQIR